MTNQNNAARPLLTDSMILHHWDAYVGEPDAKHPLTDADKIAFARIIETEVSKLRAPVADERAGFNAWLNTQRNLDDMNKAELVAAWEAWQERGRRAALASAPVAGEAREHYDEVKATLQGAHRIMESLSAIERRVGPIGSHARGYTHKITNALRHLDALYAAPQAREAVPTKAVDDGSDSWDGARKRVPKPRQAQCSCPSGDGSLRHPCAVHPKADRDKAALGIPECGGPLCGPAHHHPLCRVATGDGEEY